MRCLMPSLILAFFAAHAQACWGPYHSASYYEPVWYGPPVIVYSPYWYVPMVCECPPAQAAPPRVQPSMPAPMPEKKPAAKGSSAAPAETPYSPITPATLATPAEEKPENKLPKTDVPTKPMEVPQPMKPETPKVTVPEFKPSEVKQPMYGETKPESPKVPVPMVTVPEIKPADKPSMGVPPVNMPSLAPPAAPILPLPPLPTPMPPVKTTSQYRPPTPLQATLVPVDGKLPQDGQYRVGFFNSSDRDVTLTVNGAKVTLPKKSHVTANVAKKFEWSMDEGAKEAAVIPEAAAGAEVVIR